MKNVAEIDNMIIVSAKYFNTKYRLLFSGSVTKNHCNSKRIFERVQTLSTSLLLMFHNQVKGSAKVVAISSCGNIMDEYSREGQLWEIVRDQESYLNEISAVLKTEDHV